MTSIEELARARFGEPNRRLSTRTQMRFGRKGSVAVCLDGDNAGLWYDHEALKGGSLLRGCDDYQRPEPRSRSTGLLTWDSASEPQFRRVIDSELCRVEDAYTRGPGLRTIERSPAHEYLVSRGITQWPEHSVKGWHRAGICYLARTHSGSILACQVLPLTPEGAKDRSYWADGVTKRTYTACSGWHHYAAVRMPGRGEPILCEGVETGLSIWLATGRPVNACLGQAGTRHLRVGKRVTLARDGDDAGSPADIAFLKTVSVRRQEGQRVRISAPPVGMDFNDVHQLYGLPEVAKLIKGASEE